MQFLTFDDSTLHYRYRTGQGTPIVLLNSLGTDLRIWDGVIDRLEVDAPVLGLDKRGHGLSDGEPISMDLLVADVAALMDHLELQNALICGVSVGGLIAQGLAQARPDLVSGLVLCCTGAKIGDDDTWNARIAAVESDGISGMSEAILERWFSAGFRTGRTAELSGYRNMLVRTSADGYAGVCAAIRDTDYTAKSRAIQVPTYCIAGAEDLATPPALVQTLAGIISGATYEVIEGCGHLPCIENPARVAAPIREMWKSLA